MPPAAALIAAMAVDCSELPGQAAPLHVPAERPSGLQIDAGLSGTERVQDCKLAADEGTSLVASGVGVEEGVQVRAHHIDDGAEDVSALLPDVQRLAGGAETGVTGSRERGLRGRDEGGEFRGSAVTVEHCLVANDNSSTRSHRAQDVIAVTWSCAPEMPVSEM